MRDVVTIFLVLIFVANYVTAGDYDYVCIDGCLDAGEIPPQQCADYCERFKNPPPSHKPHRLKTNNQRFDDLCI